MIDDSEPTGSADSSGETGQSALRGLSANYSKIASRYDATRDLPEGMLAACYDRLISQGLFPPGGRILDAGCGTGQVSLPLAARGYDVRGIDIATAMTSVAQAKVRPDWRARYTVGDVRDIPAEDGSFDAAVVSKLFQHVEDWQQGCRELIRVVRPGGCIVQINERGAFGNAVRRFFSRKADERGFGNRYAGLNPHGGAELSAFMRSQGCQPVPIDMSDLRWETEISYGEAIGRIQEGLFAEFWDLPREVHDQLVAKTLAWIDTQPDGRDTVERLRPYLVVEVFWTPGDGIAV
ncbi:MAG TPA: methyltransferase domain-containing protein [Acetobacteraceae bacterium]|nr:methyltransferase domain-containing protein [Acetobacteraceae bacterium]